MTPHPAPPLTTTTHPPPTKPPPTAPDTNSAPVPIPGCDSAPDPDLIPVLDPDSDSVPILGRESIPHPDPIPGSERGYVTAETALLLPILLGIGYALALVVLLAADQIRCGDAAWEAARALARGVPAAQLPDIAARYAPAGARASAWSDAGSLTVEVDRDQSVASRFLPSIRISASATVPCEPRVDGCQTESSDNPGRPNG